MYELKESQSLNPNSEYKGSQNNEDNPFIKASKEIKNMENLDKENEEYETEEDISEKNQKK